MYPPYLTFWHWSGVTPYTSSYEFAGSYVFDKQSPGILLLQPSSIARDGQALFRSYGRFFAEFLEELSLVRLGLLDPTTCVGLWFGLCIFNLRSFSWKALHENFSIRKKKFCRLTEFELNQYPGFT